MRFTLFGLLAVLFTGCVVEEPVATTRSRRHYVRYVENQPYYNVYYVDHERRRPYYRRAYYEDEPEFRTYRSTRRYYYRPHRDDRVSVHLGF